MRTQHLLFVIILLVTSCSTDGLLIDRYEPKFSANPFLSDGYCQDVWGRMVGENTSVIFTGRYGLFTEDDFQSYRYNVFGDYENGVPCFGETVFFDGGNAWTLYYASPLSWKLSLGTTTASEAEEIGIYNLKVKHESLEFFMIQPPTVLALWTMIFTAHREGIVKVCSFIDNEVDILAEIETELIPVKVFVSDNKFYLLARSASTTESYVFSSTDGITWSDPSLITSNGIISTIKSSDDLVVAIDNDNVYVLENDNEWDQSVLPLQGQIQDIEVINGNTIYAVIGQQENLSFGWVSKLAKSTNGGNSWQLIEKDFYGESISFFDEQHGIAMAKGVLQVTHDGGLNWRLVLISDAIK
ncbi:MAG: hypothetical protein KF803_11330 [Cyclobacteriaceae bacterium]|nr:hypothetical protein [Cyclobacteriaceae bacterium]HRJ31309.1 hypothetical protein [Cyclobacteriaceae bacterium]HRJ81225.1 hypothetical protein [Cyclobacteriaceae bacterium]